MGLAPIGCAPHYMWEYRSENGECIESINDMVREFNFVMRYMIEELGEELPDSNIIFCDVFESSMDIIKNHESYGERSCRTLSCFTKNLSFLLFSYYKLCSCSGFDDTTNACCGLGEYRGWILCLSPEMACSNASNHIWWDQFHPTDAVNAILADNVWNGRHTKMCYPMHLEDMVGRKETWSDAKSFKNANYSTYG